MSQEFVARNGIISKSNLIVSGSLTALSSIVAQTLVVQTITSSVSVITGSTNWGSLSSNTHVFTGSLYQSGSTAYFVGNVLINTGSNVGANARISILNGPSEEGIAIRYLTTSSFSPIAVRDAANDVFQLNQYGRLYISGSVGIGTSSPAVTLHALGKIRSQDSRGGSYAAVEIYGGDSLFNPYISVDQSNPLTFIIGGSERMRIASSGNVGIGTTSPSQKLEVSGTDNNNLIMSTTTTGAGGTIRIQANEAASYLVSNNARPLYIQTNSSTAMTITSGGSVGVGTTGPQNTLDIVDSSYNRFTLRVQSAAANTANGWGGIGLSGEGSNTKGGILFISDGSSYSRGSIVFCNNSTADQSNASPSNERMRITSTGLVNIAGLAGSGTRTVTADSSGYLGASSDSSLKQEDTTYTVEGLAEILQLTPRAYKWLSDIERRGKEASTEIGFFANEVAPIIPSAAPKGNDGLYGFYDRAIIAAMVKAIQELTARVQELENK